MRSKGALIALVVLLISPACSQDPSSEELEMVGSLEQELASLESEVAAAQRDLEADDTPFLRALVDARLELLRTNTELIREQIHALESGTAIDPRGAARDLRRAEELAAEIEAQEAEVRRARASAEQHSSGVERSVGLATVSAAAHRLAMLRQEYLAARYGLSADPTPLAAVHRDPPRLVEPVERDFESSTPAPEPRSAVRIVEVDARVADRNEAWTRFQWVLTVRNLTDKPVEFNATIEFLDDGGFVVDDDGQSGLALQAREERTFRGYALISAASAPRVSGVDAKAAIRNTPR